LYGERIKDEYSYSSVCFINNSAFFCLLGKDISETFMYKYYAYQTVEKSGSIESISELYFNMKDGELEGIYRTDDMFGWSEFAEFAGIKGGTDYEKENKEFNFKFSNRI